MNHLSAKLLAISLSGLLSLPTGFCCAQKVKLDGQNELSGHCCQATDWTGLIPIKVVKDCCCQEWANTTAMVKPSKHLQFISLTVALPTANLFSDVPQRLQSSALFECEKNSLQSLFCIWRC